MFLPPLFARGSIPFWPTRMPTWLVPLRWSCQIRKWLRHRSGTKKWILWEMRIFLEVFGWFYCICKCFKFYDLRTIRKYATLILFSIFDYPLCYLAYIKFLIFRHLLEFLIKIWNDILSIYFLFWYQIFQIFTILIRYPHSDAFSYMIFSIIHEYNFFIIYCTVN